MSEKGVDSGKSDSIICLQCGGVLRFWPLGTECPVCEIPMRPIDELHFREHYVCKTCGKGFPTYEDILSHYCEVPVSMPRRRAGATGELLEEVLERPQQEY